MARQYRFVSLALEECGRMLGGWLEQVSGRSAPNAGPDASAPHAPA